MTKIQEDAETGVIFITTYDCIRKPCIWFNGEKFENIIVRRDNSVVLERIIGDKAIEFQDGEWQKEIFTYGFWDEN